MTGWMWGVVLNVAGDHLGLKRVETLEDLAAVKALAAGGGRQGGRLRGAQR